MTIYQRCSENADYMNRLKYYETLLGEKNAELKWQDEYIHKLEERIINLHRFIDGLNGGNDTGFLGDDFED